MQQDEFMAAEEFCEVYQVEASFLTSLEEYGLIEVSRLEEKRVIPVSRIQELEKCIHLHYDLDINVPGIEAILFLLQRVNHLQEEVLSLKSRLRAYE